MALISAYDPRKSYLTGLSRGRLGRGRLGFDPRKSYLTCGKCKGMGDYTYGDIAAGTATDTPLPSADQTADQSLNPTAPNVGPAFPVSSVNWAAILGTPSPAPPAGSVTGPGGTVATISPSGKVQAAAGYTVTPAGQIAPSSWLTQSTILSGYTNGTVAIGMVAVVGLLSVLKKTRR